MESKPLYTEAQRNDFEMAARIVEMVMGKPITVRNSRRASVDARTIFTIILSEAGYSNRSIAKGIGKDRTTVIHYVNRARDLIATDETMAKCYLRCRDMFRAERKASVKNVDPRVEMLMLSQKYTESRGKVSELKQTIDRMRERIDYLERENSYGRLKRIVELIELHTPVGHELITERKIRKLFDE